MMKKKNEPQVDPYLQSIIEKIIDKKFDWCDADEFLKYHKTEEWDMFFNKVFAEIISPGTIKKRIKCYIPGSEFPSISLTGDACALDCEHCDKKYLHHMLPATTPDKLEEILKQMKQNGKIGTLLSGGCDVNGKIIYKPFADVIKHFKDSPPGKNFYLNSHVGLVSDSEAQLIHDIGIDCVSFDVNLDPEVISNVFHLDHTIEDYKNSFQALLDNKVRVIPHILIGANFGRIKEEITALQYVAQFSPEILVFIVMIPPRNAGKMDSRFSLVPPEDIAKLILIAHYFMPSTEISLGCMRPYWSQAFTTEKWAVQAGLSRLVKPTLKIRHWLKEQFYQLDFYSACCLIPSEFEHFAKKE
ncbi:radical SAM protein [Candidatus Harpocratesius sp.]